MIEREKYQHLWDSDQQRRDEAKDILDIHDNQWRQQLVDQLSKNFAPQNVPRILSKLDMSLNVLRWASDTLAPHYSNGVVRSIEGNTEADLSVYENGRITDMTHRS